jgi:septal ring-binding cell division protein DamX
MQDASESHPIAGVFTPRLVARLHREGFEGTLRLHAGGATRVVYFRRGDIASAASNADADRLHNMLIKEGRLTAPQVDMARSRLRPGVTLGKTLIELGFLTPSELLQGARRQVRQILAACFALTDGVYQAIPGPLPPEVTNLGLPVRRLIFDALMEAGDRRAIVREMGSMESIYRPGPGFAGQIAPLRLDPAMEEVARLIDGQATLREISGRTRLDDFSVSKIVLALDILGLAEMSSPPAAAESAAPVAAEAARPGRRIHVETDAETAETPVSVRPAPDLDRPPTAGRFAAPHALPEKEPDTVTSGSYASISEGPAPARDGLAAASGPGESTVPGPLLSHEEQASGDALGRGGAPAPAAALPPESRLPLPAANEIAASPWMAAEEEPAAPLPAGRPAPAWEEPPGSEESERPPQVLERFDTSPEPPPFARGELPAFASPEAEPEGWTLDPETGEKVHTGPIEMTFDGQVGPRPEVPSAAGRWMALAAVVAVVVAAAALALYLRRGPAGDALSEPGPASGPSAVVTEPDATPIRPEVAANEPPPESAPSRQPAPSVEPAPSGETVPSGEPEARKPDTTQEPMAQEPAAQEPVAAAPAAPTPADALLPGQRLLDAGDVQRAATAFATTIASTPADRITLQLLIACDAENVVKARAATRPGGPLFVAPIRIQDRSCWRILWGSYAGRDEARAAAGDLPAYFAAAGVKPVPVSFGRLRAPA